MNGGLGKRPRHYAAEILTLATAAERREALKAVPEAMRATTRQHVKLGLDDVAVSRHVHAIATTRERAQRRAMLDEVPPAIQEKVRRRVISVMQQRRQAA